MKAIPLPTAEEPLNLYRLTPFLEVAEQLSFTRAARRLHMTQQALSTSVRRLEKDLGVTLFERTTRQVALTSAGHTLRDGSRTLLTVSREVTVQTRAAGSPAMLGDRDEPGSDQAAVVTAIGLSASRSPRA
ncbi:LysR family transcriptional regulator [Nocardia seriolae]|uniref:LysR family transcriptional regulator n=1 Tax=Nocardia seriolae TaxID=37332 RepID=A0ABC9YTL0_9NOCA|nr:LysR family transcriptional regulator [Nocardia seriolae]WKY54580.1 LysR family transcriptional regulator [Nocardia seriolae]BAW08575.1 conserved hypothetical protein [Nocardia seriolae]BEK86614.1 hypothetical protein NSERKGN1266_25650 [Nocardia seriolae]BEK94372.1 hypothetical protein NSER024013_22780 [Nocardia seriolae]GAM46771.1 LysR family transcriptional regulator [Nocardia seriolae]